MLQDYTQVPQPGSQCTYTPRIRERESSQWSISAQKTIFFFYLRLKTLTRHPLSGNEMIEYCYCKTRPLKILTVCSRDAPEQDTSLTEAPFFNTAGTVFCFVFLSFVAFGCIYATRGPGLTPRRTQKPADECSC